MRRRRKKSEECDSSGDLNVMMDLNKGRSLVWNKEVEGFPGIHVCRYLQASSLVDVKPNPISSRTKTKINIK